MVVLPAPVEPTKAIFCPGFAYSERSCKISRSGVVAEADIVEPHITAQRFQRHIRVGGIPPGPTAGRFGAGSQGAVGILAHVHQFHRALVDLGRLFHGGKDALGTGQRGQQKVALLGKLVDGQRGLAHKHQVAGQAAQVSPAFHDHQAAQHGDDRIVDIADTDHRRDHCGSIALRAGASLAQLFIASCKPSQVGLLVVEHLDDLLPGDHFLNIGVQLAQAVLLFGVVGTAVLGGKVDIPEHAPHSPPATSSESRQLRINSMISVPTT